MTIWKNFQFSSYTLFIILYSLFSIHYSLMAQCPCGGHVAIGGLSPSIGTENVGVLREGYLNLLLFNKYTHSSQYFASDIKIGKGDLNRGEMDKFHSDFMALAASYGIFNRFSLDAELGFFVNKTQDNYTYNQSSTGFSHINILGKYNIFYFPTSETELTAGLGAKIPLKLQNSLLPLHIRPSQGSFGLISLIFMHKGFKDAGMNIFLVNRTEYLFENSESYQYGPGIYTSFFISKSLFESLTAIFEIRNEYALKDKINKQIFQDSGNNLILIAPQLSFRFEPFIIACIVDYPMYQYYNGRQLSRDFSLALFISWSGKI